MWKLLDFKAELRKEKLTRKSYFSSSVIKKARKNYNRKESFSSFLIIGDHKKIWSSAKTIFGTPSLPPPFPPFPPQASVFLDLGSLDLAT